MPNSAATSVAALPLLSQRSTACCLKALSNFFRVFLDWITGVFIVALPFNVSLYLCPPNRAGPPPGEGESFAAPLKIHTTGLAGRSSAKPETNEGDSLSLGRGLKVRADVITHSCENVEEAPVNNSTNNTVHSCG